MKDMLSSDGRAEQVDEIAPVQSSQDCLTRPLTLCF